MQTPYFYQFAPTTTIAIEILSYTGEGTDSQHQFFLQCDDWPVLPSRRRRREHVLGNSEQPSEVARANETRFGSHRGTHVLIPLVVMYTLMRVNAATVVPRLQETYRPKDPPMPALMSTVNDISIGTPALPELAEFGFPLKVVVHIDCLSCTTRPLEPIRDLFRRNDILNVVASEDYDVYTSFAAENPTSKVLFSTPAFGPRVYVYDANGRLQYLQRVPSDVGTVLDESNR